MVCVGTAHKHVCECECVGDYASGMYTCVVACHLKRAAD